MRNYVSISCNTRGGGQENILIMIRPDPEKAPSKNYDFAFSSSKEMKGL